MRPLGHLAFLASAAVGALAAASALSAPETDWKPHMGGLPFVVGLDRGREESKFMGLPQMLVFTSATDRDCPMFASVTWKDPEVRAKVAGYTPVLVDFDATDAAVKTKHKVEFVPSVVWLDHEEKWLYAVYGNAPLNIFKKEAEIARTRCPKAKEPGEGMKALLEAKKRLDDGATAKDVKAQVAAIADIAKMKLGETVQIEARAADERLTKDGLTAVTGFAAVLDDKKAPGAKKAEAKKGLEALIATYGADHAVAKEAKSVLDRVGGKKK